jgi:hypothetical protein
VTKKWILEAGVQVPVHQRLNGSALETDYLLTTGFRVNFSFGSRGDGPGQFEHAIAVAVADDGTLFAVDFGNSRIHRWRPAGS